MPTTGLANAVVTGVVTGSVVALGAIGLALVYSIAEVPNFAHGELLMLGAYAALFVNRPATVPVFEALATGQQSLGTAGFAVLFVLGAGATLASISHLGGRAALEGSWWPRRPAPAVGLAVHLLAAVVVGGLVVWGFPSIWAGLLLAIALLAALAPVQERRVFRKFRARGASLATMLIVALGLSFVLRFGTQAVYGGQVRDYTVPRVAHVLGVELGLAAAKFVDVYLSGAGLVVQVIDTGPPGNPVMFTVGYPPLVLAVVLGGTALVAAGAYWWRRGDGADFRRSRTVGPKLLAAVVGTVAFVALAAFLSGPGTVPEAPAYETRISLSLMRASVIVVALVMMASLHLLLKETKLGTAMRASSDNLDLAQVSGINTDRVMMVSWVIAGAFAAVGGVMLGVLFNQLTVNMGFFLLLPMFAGVILGGLGSVYGAILGSYLVGLAMDVGIFAIPGIGATYRVPIAFVVLFVVLLVRPQGITGGA